MTTQPEALRLADVIEYPDVSFGIEAAAELRRLHEVNQELLEALKNLLADADDCDCQDNDKFCPLVRAREAIAKATGKL